MKSGTRGPARSALRLAGILVFPAVAAGLFIATRLGQDPAARRGFFEQSLHSTNNGLRFWYAKENGGLERLTGIPFDKMDCRGCHIASCDVCHRTDAYGKPRYSLEAAKSQQACEKCHDIPSLARARKNKDDPAADVHFRLGMKCMDCHTAREIHGDGTPYASLQHPGATDPRCQECHHAPELKCPSRAVHGYKLECTACHVRDIPTCLNCHMDTRIEKGKSVSVPLDGMLFLVKRKGRVQPANLHTFVYRNKAMITFAPAFTHSVVKKGRTCGDCHGTVIAEAMAAGTFKPVVLKDGKAESVRGVIPVVEGFNWDFIYLNYEDGRWTPFLPEGPPLMNYAGFCEPLNRAQFEKLVKPLADK